MDPTESDAARIPAGNLRVPRDEFLAVWREAARRAGDPFDWYPEAVARTCRWMAALPMRTALCGGQARSPVTGRGWPARAELIEAEWRAAEGSDGFSPDLATRPGWCEGVRATLRWAWARDGAAPFSGRVAVPGG